jgi:hypothetical protein
VLIPLFLIAGLLILYGCALTPRVKGDILHGRKVTVIGMGVMILASWTRGIALWGLDQQGAGSIFLATVVWGWITAGCILLLISVWTRGLQ